MVGVVLANAASTSFSIRSSALINSSDVIFPSAPSSFKAPTGTFIDLESASRTIGMFSETARNSSPLSRPLLNACESCSNADCASCVVAPLTIRALLIVSVSLIVSSCDRPSPFIARSKRTNACVVAPTSLRVRFASSNISPVSSFTWACDEVTGCNLFCNVV